MGWQFVVYLIVLAISTAVSIALQKRPKDVKPGKLEIPTNEQGQGFRSIWGTPPRIKGNMILWYGDYYAKKIKTRSGWSKTTTGYQYHLGMHMGLAHSNIDGVVQLWCDTCVWPTLNDPSVFADEQQTRINYHGENIFGGKRFGGGISGAIDILYGNSDQEVNDYLGRELGTLVPAFRGVTSAVFRRCYWGESKVLPTLGFVMTRVVRQHDGTDQWYLAKARVGTLELNAIHAIRELMTSKVVGCGIDADRLDSTSFEAAADTCYTEGIGLSFSMVPLSEKVSEILAQIEQIIDGYIVYDMTSGLYKINLVRDDYDPDGLVTYTEDDFEIENFTRPVYKDTPSTTIVYYMDRESAEEAPAQEDDISISQMQAIPVTQEYHYGMICDPVLAQKIAAREQNEFSAMPAGLTLKCKRTMYDILRGDPFKITHPKLTDIGITSMTVRAAAINRGTLEEGTITMDVVQDIFSDTSYTYDTNPATEWESVINAAEDVTVYALIEAPYWTLVRDVYGATFVEGLSDDTGLLLLAAESPTDDANGYETWVMHSAGTSYYELGDGSFVPTAKLAVLLPRAYTDESSGAGTTVRLYDTKYLDQVVVGSLAQIDNELVEIVSVDTDTDTICVDRGVLDTVPADHPQSTVVFFFDSELSWVPYEYTDGDTPTVKFLTTTSEDTLDIDDATGRVASAMNSRYIRPYIAGNVLINGEAFPTNISGSITLTWNDRDRTDSTQKLQLIGAGEATDYGPEAGTTYRVDIYDSDGNLVSTYSGLTGNTWTYTEAIERADFGIPSWSALNTDITLKFTAVRNGYDSWQSYEFDLHRFLEPTEDEAGHIFLAGQVICYEGDRAYFETELSEEVATYLEDVLCYDEEVVSGDASLQMSGDAIESYIVYNNDMVSWNGMNLD